MTAGPATGPGSNPGPYRLRADGRHDPIGVATGSPRLTWAMRGPAPVRTVVQGAATLDGLVAGRADRFELSLGPDAPPWAPWPGVPLASRERAWWRVGAVPADDPAVAGAPASTCWSEPASVEAPPWTDADWPARRITHAAWVTPAAAPPPALPELEGTIRVPGPVRSARLYLSASGVVVPTIDGAQAIDGELEPGYSALGRGVPASAWDVTSFVHPGPVVLRLALGGGIAFVPALAGRYTKLVETGHPVWARASLEIVLADGSSVSLVTDGSWRARLSGTRVAHWYGGEDAEPGTHGDWEAACRVEVAGQQTWWRSVPPVRVVDRLVPAGVDRRPDGSRVVDLGVNIAGRPVLELRHAVPGRPIVVRPAEQLTSEGDVDQRSIGGPTWDSLVPQTATVAWHPRFVYHGFRWLQVAGLAPDEADDAVRAEVLRADDEPVGTFQSSDPFLAGLHRIIDRAVQGNLFSVVTDCPHREKLGWLEELHLCFEALARGYDVRAQLADAVRHMVDAQEPGGLVPSHVPELIRLVPRLESDRVAARGDLQAFRDDPNWGRAIVEVPWLVYEWYGDPRLLEATAPAAERWFGHLERRSAGDLLDHGLGDWIEIDHGTPRGLVATHGWATALATAARSAIVLGDDATAARYAARAARVRAALRARYRDPATGTWGSGSQASWALAWSSGAKSADEGPAIAAGLLASIDDAGGAITVGEVALPSLIRCLTDSGHAAVLDRLIRRTDAAGYGAQLAMGMTALGESWHGLDALSEGASQNHFMLGAIDGWLTGDVAGLRQAPGSVGWGDVVVRPVFLDGVHDAATTFESPRGRMAVRWARTPGGRIDLDVDLPPGVRSRIDVPPTVDVRLRQCAPAVRGGHDA